MSLPILHVSDLQAPYVHPDAVRFLRAVKAKYGPFQFVIMGGDEIDNNALNDYELDPDGLSHGEELNAAIETLTPIYKLFPRAIVLKSNHVHGRLERRRRAAGLSLKVMRSIGDIIKAPHKWKWVDDFTYKVPETGQHVYYTHGMDADGLRLAKSLGMCVVQFHFHTKFAIQYHSSPHWLTWSLQSGCLVDTHAPALRYSKKNKDREVIGVSMLVKGQPRLLPMLLNKRGRWGGVVP